MSVRSLPACLLLPEEAGETGGVEPWKVLWVVPVNRALSRRQPGAPKPRGFSSTTPPEALQVEGPEGGHPFLTVPDLLSLEKTYSPHFLRPCGVLGNVVTAS